MRLTTRHLFVAIFVLGLFAMALRPVADPDFWWHLRTGQWILENGQIPHGDPFSFTNFGKEWTAHEWLSEVILYGLYRLGGLPLLIFVFALVITAAFVIVYLRSPGKPFVAVFALLLGALATAPTWGVRPQMFSLLLSSVFLYLLDRYQETGNHRHIIHLPFMTVLWVNLHAGFALGIFLTGAYIASQGINFLKALAAKDEEARGAALHRGLTFALAFLACLLAVLVNPNGARMYSYPFETLTSPSMMMFIQEWASPDFHLAEWQPLAWLLLALIAAGILGRKPANPAHLLLTIVLGYFSLRSMRNVSLFALAAIPLLAAQAAAVFRTGPEVRAANRLGRWLNPLLLALVLLAVGLRFASVALEQEQAEAETYPVAAVDWIDENRPEGQIYNTYGWGGYVLWRLPGYPVYIDGRADLYGDQFIYDYLAVYRAEPGWETTLEAADVGLALLESGSPLAHAMADSPDWQRAFSDELSVVYTRP